MTSRPGRVGSGPRVKSHRGGSSHGSKIYLWVDSYDFVIVITFIYFSAHISPWHYISMTKNKIQLLSHKSCRKFQQNRPHVEMPSLHEIRSNTFAGRCSKRLGGHTHSVTAWRRAAQYLRSLNGGKVIKMLQSVLFLCYFFAKSPLKEIGYVFTCVCLSVCLSARLL